MSAVLSDLCFPESVVADLSLRKIPLEPQLEPAIILPFTSSAPKMGTFGQFEVRHNHWKCTPIPLGHFDPEARAHYYRKLRWNSWRDDQLDRLRWGVENNRNALPVLKKDVDVEELVEARGDIFALREKWEWAFLPNSRNRGTGALYRYLNWCWTHMHPNQQWPDWWGEQNEAFEWLADEYDVPYNWRNELWAGAPFDPDIWTMLLFSGALIRIGGVLQAPSGSSPAVMPQNGEYALDVNNLSGIASNSNDGIIGSDGPWLTAQKGFEEMQAATPSGNKIWIRGGSGSYWAMTDAIATALSLPNPVGVIVDYAVEVRGWPGDSPRARISNDRTSLGQEAFVCRGTSGAGFYNIDIACAYACLSFGNNSAAANWEYIDIKRYSNGRTESGQGSPIHMDNGSGAILIEGYETIDTVPGQGNHAEQYYVNNEPGTIFRNSKYRHDYRGTGVSIIAFYHKRANPGSSAFGDTTVRNVYVAAASNQVDAVVNNARADYHDYINNIMVAEHTNAFFAIYKDQTGDSGPPDWTAYRNRHLHNTSYADSAQSTSNWPHYMLYGDVSTVANSLEENVVRDCLFAGNYFAINADALSRPHDHQTSMDYNHFDSPRVATYWRTYAEATSWDTLASFRADSANNPQAYYQEGANHNLNSVQEAVNFAVTVVFGSIGTFALNSASAGYLAASDGTDMGADCSLVGPAALGY